MKPVLARKIVEFSLPSSEGNPSFCLVCGARKLAGSFCNDCAFRLIDIALSSIPSEESGSMPALAGNADATTPSASPQRYGHYEVCRTPAGLAHELGRGSMGITYKALDTHLGRPAALKVINARYIGGVEARERFLREARTAASLRHVNIASVFHLGLEEENCFYAMEYIVGETLEECVRRQGKLPSVAALRIVAQAARALRAAHSQCFVHRDIKPTNIMLSTEVEHADEEVTAKLIDFGLVKVGSDDNWLSRFCDSYFAGTPQYASPEQLNHGLADVRSDIYSLGMCLRFMLTGRHPQKSAPEDEVADIPAPVTALLASMTATDQALRPQTAAELIRQIQDCSKRVSDEGHGPLTPTVERQIKAGGSTRPANEKKSFGGKMMIAVVCICALLAMFLCHAFAKNQKTASDKTEDFLQSRVLCAQGDEYRNKYTTEDNQKAVKRYTEAIAQCPELADAHAGLALAYWQKAARYGGGADAMDRAIEYARRAIAIAPEQAKAYEALGLIRWQQGKTWEALTQIRRAIELNPQGTQAMHYFSTMWTSVGQPQLGLPWARKVVQIEPTNTSGWKSAADASVDLCADRQAELYYRRCLEINPRMMAAHCGLLHIHLLEGDFTQAQQDFATANAVDPGLLHPLILKAQIELFSGNYAAAEATYRRLLAMDRNGAVNYYGGISYLSALAFLRQQAGDLTESQALLDEVCQKYTAQDDSEGPLHIYDLAAIRCIQGRQDDALILLNKAFHTGWLDHRATQLDPRFLAIRASPQFVSLMEEMSAHTDQMREEAERRCADSPTIAAYPVRPPVR